MENLKMESSQPSMTPESELDHLDYATERARVMLGCYRKGEANDPQMYSSAVAAMLANYPREVIDQVTHPLMGLPSRTDFMPTLKELKSALEQEIQRHNRIHGPTTPNYIAYLRGIVKSDVPPFEEMYKKHGRFVGPFEQPGDKWNAWGNPGETRYFVYGSK